MVSEMLRWLIIPYEHNLWDGKWDIKMVDYPIWTQSMRWDGKWDVKMVDYPIWTQSMRW